MGTIINYVISLTNANKRRKYITNLFSSHKINFKFFDAISENNGLSEAMSALCPQLRDVISLSNGEKGCLLSHLALWRKCIDDNISYISIFEDDIVFGKNARSFLCDDQWLTNRISTEDNVIIKLETFLIEVNVSGQTEVDLYQNRSLKLLGSNHPGTAGYVISKGAAKYLLDKVRALASDKIYAVDDLIFCRFLTDPQLKVYQLDPAICIQESLYAKNKSQLPSQLENDRLIVRKKNYVEKTPWQRFKKEWYNLFHFFERKRQKKLEKIREIIDFL